MIDFFVGITKTVATGACKKPGVRLITKRHSSSKYPMIFLTVQFFGRLHDHSGIFWRALVIKNVDAPQHLSDVDANTQLVN